jgi:hypothetical protein
MGTHDALRGKEASGEWRAGPLPGSRYVSGWAVYGYASSVTELHSGYMLRERKNMSEKSLACFMYSFVIPQSINVMRCSSYRSRGGKRNG